MKILFVSRRFYPEIIGGGQISAFYIAKAVKKQGHDVFVCTFTDKKNSKFHEIDEIKIFRMSIPKLKFFPRFSNMDYMYYQMAKLSSKHIKKIKPDIIHLLNFETIPFASIYYKKKFNLPIVATVNGPNFGCFTGSGVDYKKNTCINCKVGKRLRCSIDKWGLIKSSLYYGYSIYYMKLLKLSYKRVDKFFAVSKAMVPLLKNMNVPRRKITVIHNPVEIKNKVKTNLKNNLGLKNKKVIIFVGRLTQNKGIQNTIKAMQFIDNAVFLVLGRKKGYYSELKKLTLNLNLSEKVKFVGFVDKKKLREFYSISDTAILTGSFYEPFSRFLLEAASYGIPLVALDVGGNSEIINHEKNGLLIKNTNPKIIANAINRVLNNETFHKKMSKGSIKHVNKSFELKNIGKKLAKEYSETLKIKQE